MSLATTSQCALEARYQLKRVLRWTEATGADPELARLLRRCIIRIGLEARGEASLHRMPIRAPHQEDGAS